MYLHTLKKPVVYSFPYAIAGVALLAMIGTSHSAIMGYSIGLGGWAWVVLQAYVVWRCFRKEAVFSAKQFVTTFYRSEMVKLLALGLIFLTVAKLLPVLRIEGILAGYLVAQGSFYITFACKLEK